MPTLIIRCHNVDWSHSLLSTKGYMGVYDELIKSAKLRPGDRVLWFYPFTTSGYQFVFRDTHFEQGFHDVCKAVEDQGAKLIAYLPCIKSGDTWNFRTIEAKQTEIMRLIDCLPDTCGIVFDEGANVDVVAHDLLVQEMKFGKRLIGTEPCRFSYSSWSDGYDESFENYDHFCSNPVSNINGIVRDRGTHTLLEHHLKPDGWDRAAWLLDFTRECKGLGFDWGVLAQPNHLNETGQVEMDHVDPEKN